jgi:hypothetical protein
MMMNFKNIYKKNISNNIIYKMDSFARAKLKSENVVIRSQLDELNHKLDIVNSSLNKYIQINQKQEQLILNLDEKYNSL